MTTLMTDTNQKQMPSGNILITADTQTNMGQRVENGALIL